MACEQTTSTNVVDRHNVNGTHDPYNIIPINRYNTRKALNTLKKHYNEVNCLCLTNYCI